MTVELRTVANPTTAPDTLTRPHDWQDQALCARPDAEPDWWAADGHSTDASTAIKWCRACPAQQQCLDEAMRREGNARGTNRHGIWGGLTPHARRDLYDAQRQEATAA
jgi:hypothetical protein